MFILDKFKSICFCISMMFIVKLRIDEKNIVIAYENMLILGILVKQKSITNSIVEIISEFLRIMPCLFKPLRMPNIVLAGIKLVQQLNKLLYKDLNHCGHKIVFLNHQG